MDVDLLINRLRKALRENPEWVSRVVSDVLQEVLRVCERGLPDISRAGSVDDLLGIPELVPVAFLCGGKPNFPGMVLVFFFADAPPVKIFLTVEAALLLCMRLSQVGIMVTGSGEEN